MHYIHYRQTISEATLSMIDFQKKNEAELQMNWNNSKIWHM